MFIQYHHFKCLFSNFLSHHRTCWHFRIIANFILHNCCSTSFFFPHASHWLRKTCENEVCFRYKPLGSQMISHEAHDVCCLSLSTLLRQKYELFFNIRINWIHIWLVPYAHFKHIFSLFFFSCSTWDFPTLNMWPNFLIKITPISFLVHTFAIFCRYIIFLLLQRIDRLHNLAQLWANNMCTYAWLRVACFHTGWQDWIFWLRWWWVHDLYTLPDLLSFPLYVSAHWNLPRQQFGMYMNAQLHFCTHVYIYIYFYMCHVCVRLICIIIFLSFLYHIAEHANAFDSSIYGRIFGLLDENSSPHIAYVLLKCLCYHYNHHIDSMGTYESEICVHHCLTAFRILIWYTISFIDYCRILIHISKWLKLEFLTTFSSFPIEIVRSKHNYS